MLENLPFRSKTSLPLFVTPPPPSGVVKPLVAGVDAKMTGRVGATVRSPAAKTRIRACVKAAGVSISPPKTTPSVHISFHRVFMLICAFIPLAKASY